jgi:uncharacterized RDD family membrane protein YckC
VVGWFAENIVDNIISYTILSVVGFHFTQANAEEGILSATQQAALAKYAVIWLIYVVVTKVVTLGLLGWTPGMLLTGIRVVRWNGKPCGLPRALLRTVTYEVWLLIGVGAFLGVPIAGTAAGFGWLFLFVVCTWYVKGHKSIHDVVAGTYVVDAMAMDHMIIIGVDGVYSGPAALTREEALKQMQKSGMAAPATGHPGGPAPDGAPGTAVVPASASTPAAPAAMAMGLAMPHPKSGEPVYDKNLDTYVVWNGRRGAWLAFDKEAGGWRPLG